jgi:uncharacterized protein (TIGR02996 family)
MDRTLLPLIRACKDEPFDVTRRLILADWLEEHGDADRAELVRLQMALDDAWGDEPDRPAMEVRCAELVRTNAERWLGPARQWYGRADFRRGFLCLNATAEELRLHPPAELPDEVVPWLEELYVRQGVDDALLVSPTLRYFSHLQLSGSSRPLGGDELGLLLANPALEECRRLDFYSNQINADCARALARCERLARLRELNLNRNPVGDLGLTELAQAPWLRGLTRLDLGDTGVGADGLAALLGSPHLGTLTELELTNITIDAAAARILSESPKLAGLELLSFECGSIDMPGLRRLARSPHLRPAKLKLDYVELGMKGVTILTDGRLLERVRELHLNSNSLTPEASAALISSPRLASLEFLPLWDPVGDVGCEALAAAEHLGNLRRVCFMDADIGPKGAAALGRARGLKSLISLGLADNPIGPAGLRGLAEGDGLPALEGLVLSETRPQARGLQALAGSGIAARLKRLDLDNNRLTDRAAVALARMPAGRLVELDLGRNRIGPEGIAAMASSPHLTSLAILMLYSNRIRDEGVRAIIASPHLRGLSDLDVRKNGLTSAGAEALRDWPHRERMTELWIEDRGISEALTAEACIA